MTGKTGFVLANVHQGSGIRAWDSINSEALSMGNGALFVLPGGRLGYRKADEYLRNSIYRFVRSDNLDGAVVWGSTLVGEATWKEAENFIQNLSSSMPVVSMGINVRGVPSVNFDAYSGTYRIVDHMIKRHGARRIAFLRGPEKHESAEDRYMAYVDALKDNSIPYDPRLVSSPMAWGEGENAIKEIVEKNGMVPKRDFTALVTPSDLMNSSASRYLEDKGYLIPDDVATAGFNDSNEAYITSVESTTVRMPLKEMIDSSFALICEMEKDREGVFSNLSLPSLPVYRRSCGCLDPFGSPEYAKKTIHTWKDYESWIQKRLPDAEASKAMIYILHDIFEKNLKVSRENRRHYEELCWRYLKHGGTMKLFFSIVKWARILLGERNPDMDEMELLRDIVMEQCMRVNATENLVEAARNKAFNDLGADLLKVLSYREMGEALSRNLPAIGIGKAFVFIQSGDGESRLVTGFSEGRILDEGESFADTRIYPETMEREFEEGVFIILPLYYDSSVEGYLVMQNEGCPAKMVENIRNSASATLQTINLYEIAKDRSRKAEEAEKKSSQFYATLAEDLKEPLDAIKAMADCGDLDEEILLALSTKAEHILQLSLSDKGELEMDPCIVPGSLLRKEIEDRGINVTSPSMLPSLFLDIGKVSEVLDFLSARARSAGDTLSMEIMVESDHLVIRTSGNVFDVSSLSGKDPSVLLSEKIMVMHGGTFRFGRKMLDIIFPFPSISETTSKVGGDKGVLFISSKEGEIPEGLGLGKITSMAYEDVVQRIGEIHEYSSIAWNINDGGKASNVAMTVLKNHRDTRSMPFLCYGYSGSSITLNTAVEGALLSSEKATFYSFGAFPKALEKLKDFGNVQTVSSPSDIKEGSRAALFIIQEADPGLIEGIRKRRAFAKTPVLIVKEKLTREEADGVSQFPEVLMVNTSITESEDFLNRLVSLVGGDELLPPMTSILVKRAIAYLNEFATRSISRWQIAACVNISEDYLTRIFRKEVGLSPWDYLNRFRIQIASKLLLETGASISEIASMTGFQDQAYFCRVFRKVKGFPPGNIRSRSQG